MWTFLSRDPQWVLLTVTDRIDFHHKGLSSVGQGLNLFIQVCSAAFVMRTAFRDSWLGFHLWPLGLLQMMVFFWSVS